MTPRVSHVEWYVTDLDRAVALLSGLFGWRFETFSTHYRLYTPDTGACVGLMEVDRVRPGSSPMVHVQVEDLDGAVARAVDLGARLHVAPTEIPGYGRYAQVLDGDGNIVGLFEAVSQP